MCRCRMHPLECNGSSGDSSPGVSNGGCTGIVARLRYQVAKPLGLPQLMGDCDSTGPCLGLPQHQHRPCKARPVSSIVKEAAEGTGAGGHVATKRCTGSCTLQLSKHSEIFLISGVSKQLAAHQTPENSALILTRAACLQVTYSWSRLPWAQCAGTIQHTAHTMQGPAAAE